MTSIYIDGVFDLPHHGHFNLIRQAASTCAHVCVGINSDQEAYAVKRRRPILSNAERQEILAACRWTSRTIGDTPYETSLDYLDRVAKCDFACHGNDTVVGISGKDCYEEVRLAGRFKVCNRTSEISTTQIVARALVGCVRFGLLSEEEVCEVLGNSAMQAPIIRRCLSLSQLVDFMGDDGLKGAKLRHGKKVVYACGPFDILRGEHIRYLKEAKSHGDYLLVGIDSDDEFRVQSVLERSLGVFGLQMVDEVVINAPKLIDEDFVRRHEIQCIVLEQSRKCLVADDLIGLDSVIYVNYPLVRFSLDRHFIRF